MSVSGTEHHQRFTAWLTEMQGLSVVIGGVMTDVKAGIDGTG